MAGRDESQGEEVFLLMKNEGIRAIYIFGTIAFEQSSAEGNHPPTLVRNGEHDAVGEEGVLGIPA